MIKTSSTNGTNRNAFKGTQELITYGVSYYAYLDHQLSAFSALLAATVVQSDHKDEGDY